MTFDELCKAEPRLRSLYNEAVNVDTQGDYSALSKFFGYGKFRASGIKPRLVLLVGWQRRPTDELSSTEAYDVAYKTILDALPDDDGNNEPDYSHEQQETF
jgi:hypothetical protein